VVRKGLALGLTLAGLVPFVASATVFNLTASLDAAQETTCTLNSAARGQTPTLTFDDASGTLTYSITFGTNAPNFDNGQLNGGAAPTLAHFHGPAFPGQTAGIVTNGTIADLTSPMEGSFVAAAGQPRVDLMNGLWYINIHSNACPSGEIRGQVLTLSSGPAVSGWGAWALAALMLGAAAYAVRGEFRRA
jgi:hypothetical protein